MHGRLDLTASLSTCTVLTVGRLSEERHPNVPLVVAPLQAPHGNNSNNLYCCSCSNVAVSAAAAVHAAAAVAAAVTVGAAVAAAVARSS